MENLTFYRSPQNKSLGLIFEWWPMCIWQLFKCSCTQPIKAVHSPDQYISVAAIARCFQSPGLSDRCLPLNANSCIQGIHIVPAVRDKMADCIILPFFCQVSCPWLIGKTWPQKYADLGSILSFILLCTWTLGVEVPSLLKRFPHTSCCISKTRSKGKSE